MQLTDSQREAVEHRGGHLQLIACAGSGKTEVVARRIASLLGPPPRGGLLPANVVAFTFTEKAAGELKERIVSRCREEHGEIVGLAEMFVGTIHAFCLELLKTEVPECLKLEVLNQVQQTLLIDRNSRRSGLTASTDLNGSALRRYVDTGRFVEAMSILREAEFDEAQLSGNSVYDNLETYRSLLDEKGYLDYSEILHRAVEVLSTNAEVRARVAARVKHVVVDEYQDVNPVQEALVWLLRDLGAELTVVGDDDQTIYQWRGSDVGNILTFPDRYDGAAQKRLEENFRSSEGIVATARDFIRQNPSRLEKEMKPASEQVFEPGDVVSQEFPDPEAEARFIAETIAELRGLAFREDGEERGLDWSDMAILLRSVKRNGAPITRALQEAGIPFIVAGMNNLFETPEAAAARQLFRMMASRAAPGDVVAAWEKADTGVSRPVLEEAVRGAEASRDRMLGESEERWNVYNVQRVFLAFLEDLGLREESVPGGRGEVLFYNLGKFSQLISDFESIHFHSPPRDKYPAFADFLEHGAEDAYPEGWQENQYANPNAVRVMTVHQAKGMQWPVVFVPALIRNRFPARAQGGKSVWHLLPAPAITGAARFRGSVEDERRLFYVAMTRSQKCLFLTWAPVPGNQQSRRRSEFLDDVWVSKYVKRRGQNYSGRRRLPPRAKKSVANVVLSFSDVKYFFECPYQFKLRVLYGFNAPLDEAIGYGKSLHDALAEVHARALRGDFAGPEQASDLVARHLRTPYAYASLKQALTREAEKVVAAYIETNRADFPNIEMTEKGVEIHLGEGVSVKGRVDLVRRLDTDETTIVDLKSTKRAQAEDVTETQLHTYALGYEELTGRRADYVEIYNLDEGRGRPRAVDDDFIADVKTHIREAADGLRSGAMPPRPEQKRCAGCDYRRLCTAGCAAGAS